MDIILEHQFRTKAHDLRALFDNVDKMSTFMRKIEQQSVMDVDRYDADKYKGDAFEFFIELFLKLHPCDNRIGLYDYHPVQKNDNGVDGYGMNILGQKSVVQVKYRGNTQSLLTANQDHLSNMFSDGMLEHNVIADNANPKNYRHFVFTTAEGLHFYTDSEMYKSKVKCIGYKDFRNLLDNNIAFWTLAKQIVEFTINSR